jgi:HEAT repeat protein
MNLKATHAMSKSTLNLLLAAALLCAGAALAPAQPFGNPLAKESEASLIAILQSNAPQKDKADACLQLARVGTQAAVPALAALLPDEKLNHMARYGLETIPDASVDRALRAALGTLSGRPLVGVIGSIGVRRDAGAIEPLEKLLQNADTDVAQAAARALGKIGTAAAAGALEKTVAEVPASQRLAFCEGLFRCAETLTAAGQRDRAIAIYDRLRALPEPHQVRTGALRGAILARGPDGLPLLRESLRSPDYLLVAAAVRTAQSMPGAEVTEALTAALDQAPPDNQILMLQALGLRADPSALPAVTALAKNGSKPVRVAALRELAQIGSPAAAPFLIALLGDADREIAQTAQESLAALAGSQVDAAVMAMLDGTDTAQRVTAIDLIARRRMTSAVPALLKTAGDADSKVRAAALKRVGELATVDQLPALTDFLMQAKGAQDVEAAEQAVSAVCSKSGDPELCAAKLAGLISQAGPAQKSALVRILSTVGGPTALQAVRGAVADSDPAVHASAIRALGDWKTADAAPDLLALAKAADNPTDRQLCLRSYLTMVRNNEWPADQRLAMCRAAAGLVQSKDEKRLLLAALASVQTAQSVALIAPYLQDAESKEEATAATLGIAEKLLRGKDTQAIAALIDPLQKAAQATTNPDLAKRAQDLLSQAQKKAGKN